MRRIPVTPVTLLVSTVFMAGSLIGQDSPWANKRIPEWSERDALQVLYSSPWVGMAAPNILGGLTPFARRDGGDMNAEGAGNGAGLGALLSGQVTSLRELQVNHATVLHKGKIEIRWESALPIRAAEIKANESGAPDLDGEDYAICVYNVSIKEAVVELKHLPEMLKKTAFLKIEGRKDLKPDRVDVIEPGGGLISIIYLFPRSARITTDDKRLEFSAMIGRVGVAQYFYPPQMLFLGKLEL